VGALAAEDDLLAGDRSPSVCSRGDGSGRRGHGGVPARERLVGARRFMSAFALEEVSDLAAVTVAVRQIRALAT
jgi:hypothetical protein